MKTPLRLFATALTLTLATGSLRAYEPWPEDAIDAFSHIPVLSEGRVKPMGTVAYFTLLEMNGRTSVEFEENGLSYKLSASEWLMDLLFRPDVAKKQEVFLVDDNAAVTAIGVSVTRKGSAGDTGAGKKKRDRFSYDELAPGRSKLAELSSTFARKQQADQPITPMEEIILRLGKNVNAFEFLASSLTPAQPAKLINAEVIDPEMRQLAQTVQVSELLQRMPPMPIPQIEQRMMQDPSLLSEDERIVMSAYKLLYFFNRSGTRLTLFPSENPEVEEWVSPGELIRMVLEDDPARPWALERIIRLEALAAAAGSPATSGPGIETFRAGIHAEADARGEVGAIAMEVKLYDKGYIDNATTFFVFAFILVAASWLTPASRIGRGLTVASIYLGIFALVSLVTGMVFRSSIRGWAPITNLYETFLFIGASAFVFGLIFELFNRNRIALSVGTLVPAICLILSGQFVLINPGDTLPPLVAVLRSNFWLYTHVITITLGYSAGLVGALVAHFWIIGQAFNIQTGNKTLYRNITRMTYGIVLFSLLFSLVGTVLGGIWANYSWGRFWGWDPKENGALMIVLWTLVILHARLGGFIKDLGIHAYTIILGIIISFSWFGTNALGVGLHSYGFAAGIWRALYTYWGIEMIFISMAIYLKFRDRLPLPDWMRGRATA